jgi:hypothetical protein
MPQIPKPILSRFRNGEFLHFMITVLDLYKEFDSKSLLMEARVNEFEQKVNIMKYAFMASKGETFSGKLRPLDNERINVLKGLKRYLQAEFYRSDPEKKNSATILLKSYDRYNAGITRKSFQYKTAVITNLLENWNSKPEFSNALQVLGANSWIEELTLKNNTFYEQYFKKAISSVPKAQSNKMKADIKAVFEELIMDTTSFARVSPDNPKYNKLIKELTGIINTNYQPIANRHNRKKKEPAPYVQQDDATDIFELDS